MISSRLRRVEERNASRRIAVAIIGTVALLVFLALFGVRILIGFSLMVDRIRGSSQQPQSPQAIILPPVLDPLPEATGSARIIVRGKAAPKAQVILYVNDTEYNKLTADTDGVFESSGIPVEEGTVTVRAKLVHEISSTSDFSNAVTTVVDRTAPKLVVDAPEDNTTINDGTHKVAISGMTDEGMKLTINGRIVVVKADGSFSYSMPLNDGENKLAIVSRDPAGNEITVERSVTYLP